MIRCWCNWPEASGLIPRPGAGEPSWRTICKSYSHLSDETLALIVKLKAKSISRIIEILFYFLLLIGCTKCALVSTCLVYRERFRLIF